MFTIYVNVLTCLRALRITFPTHLVGVNGSGIFWIANKNTGFSLFSIKEQNINCLFISYIQTFFISLLLLLLLFFVIFIYFTYFYPIYFAYLLFLPFWTVDFCISEQLFLIFEFRFHFHSILIFSYAITVIANMFSFQKYAFVCVCVCMCVLQAHTYCT